MINIYVGNLPYKTCEADLVELFSSYGQVERATLVMDRQTGRARGFGFVEMTDHAAGTRAIEALAGQEWNGRPLTINEARPRGSGSGGSGHSGGGGHAPNFSSTPSFGGSNGYTNTLGHAPADATPPENPAPGSPENPETPGSPDASGSAPADGEAHTQADDAPSRGYSNSMAQQ